jgi:hypothetical protein
MVVSHLEKEAANVVSQAGASEASLKPDPKRPLKYDTSEGDNPMPIETIGLVTLLDERVYRKQDYETAAWYTDIEVQPGVYAMTAEVEGDRVVRDSVRIVFPGRVVKEHFVTLLGGLPIGGTSHELNLGKRAEYQLRPRDFDVIRWIESGTQEYGVTVALDRSFLVADNRIIRAEVRVA